jgi:hypothetical protein
MGGCNSTGDDWEGCRRQLQSAAFGTMPTRTTPDAIIPITVGVADTGRGDTTTAPTLDSNGGAQGGVTRNTTALVWTITDGPLTLNATVYYTLNTTYPTVVCDTTGTFLPPCHSGQTTKCCNGTYISPPTYGHFAGQVHVNNGSSSQTPFSLPITGADTGPRDLPRRRTKTLVLYHNGHGQLWNDNSTTHKVAVDPLCVRLPDEPRLTAKWHAQCWVNWDTVPGWVNELGFDVMEFNMPLLGPNNNGSIGSRRHEWFEQWEARGVKTMRFFLEPVSLAINYAQTLGYTRFVMIGLSGGGWSTTVASALDPRIGLSIPVAGSIPFSMRKHPDHYHDGGDWEQYAARPIYQACDYKCMYTLAGLEPGRVQVQVLHEADPCCFRAGQRHAAIIDYNREIAERLGNISSLRLGNISSLASGKVAGVLSRLAHPTTGSMCTAATAGNVHEVNMRDKALVAYLIDRFDAGALSNLPGPKCAELPFNVLHHW